MNFYDFRKAPFWGNARYIDHIGDALHWKLVVSSIVYVLGWMETGASFAIFRFRNKGVSESDQARLFRSGLGTELNQGKVTRKDGD